MVCLIKSKQIILPLSRRNHHAQRDIYWTTRFLGYLTCGDGDEEARCRVKAQLIVYMDARNDVGAGYEMVARCGVSEAENKWNGRAKSRW